MKKVTSLMAMLAVCFLTTNAHAFTFLFGQKAVVDGNTMTFLVDIPGVSNSGISWNDAFDQAIGEWSMTTPIQLNSVHTASDPCVGRFDKIGGVGFSSHLCGFLPGYSPATAAIALPERITNTVIANSDIVYNSNLTWDVYDGTTRLDLTVLPEIKIIVDFRRVSLHEVGHGLGLNHSSFPRSVLTDSARQVFDLDRLNADDICGVNIAHGNPDGCPLLLPNPLTVSGKSTSAIFVGGASSDRGDTYKDWFARTDVIDVMATVVVEDAHFGLAGRLHAVAQLSDGTTMIWGSRGFGPWDGSVEDLRAISDPRILSGANEIYLLEDFDLAASGLSNVGVAFYIGYSLESGPSEVYYSGTPIQFHVQ